MRYQNRDNATEIPTNYRPGLEKRCDMIFFALKHSVVPNHINNIWYLEIQHSGHVIGDTQM